MKGTVFVARDGRQVVAMASLLYTVSTAEGGKAALFEDSSPRSTANAASASASSTSSPRRAQGRRAAHHVTHRHAERARAGNVPARRIRRLADEADAPQAEEVLGAKILRKVAENGTSSAFSSIMRAHLAMQHRQVVVRHRGVKMVLDVVVHMVRKISHASHAGTTLVRAAVSGEEKSVVAPCSAIARRRRIARPP